ncbi:MAG TPA: sulfatase, partial [Vicinamibacteria bacterium]|nr:sulfatase [Vicinamibacteria bacterium]
MIIRLLPFLLLLPLAPWPLSARGPQAPPAAPAAVSQPAPAGATARPLNVILIVADDLYWKIGAYGHAPVRTPHLDRLAARGRRFDAAYNQYPLCNPSRTSLMTGWRPERTRVWGNADPPRPLIGSAVPLQELFAARGYYTARVGKIFHGPFETQFRWDLSEDPPELPAGVVSDDEEFSARIIPTAGDDAGEPDGRTARRAAQVIEQNRERPFFVAVGFLRPHGPWMAPRRYFDMYPPAQVTLPAPPRADLDDVPRVALKRGAEPDIPAGRSREALAAYYACITFMDAQLGVVLDTLDRLSLWDSTVVVFVSDHGIQRGEHGLWRKNVLFEESARVPLIVAAPQVRRPGTAAAGLVELIDVYPTVADLAGVPPPSPL